MKIKKIILFIFLFILVFFSFKSCTKAAFMDYVGNPWFLDPYQYAEVYNYNGTNNRAYTSSDWGVYTQGPGFLHKFGAIVQNPTYIQNSPNQNQDYFLLPGEIYLVTINFTSPDVKILNTQQQLLRDYGNYRSINIRLKYLSTNGGYNYVTIVKDNLAYYSINRFSDYDVQFNFLVTLPDEPSDMNSEYMTMDIWIDAYNCDTSDGEACGVVWHEHSMPGGINLFQMSYATIDVINDYLTTVNTSNSVFFSSATADRIQNVQVILDNMEGQLADLNDILHSMEAAQYDYLKTSWIPQGPIDSIITLPLKLIQSLNNSIGGSCSPITLNLPFVHRNITLPCLSTIYNQIGLDTFLNWVGVLASTFMLYYYFKHLFIWVEKHLTLQDSGATDWGGV